MEEQTDDADIDQSIVASIEEIFRTIHKQKMQEVPMCNPALQVQAVGFQRWQNYLCGILITPWFMNLMLLPLGADLTTSQVSGSKRMLAFPSGQYEFIFGSLPELPAFEVCSLFSPMQDFSSQAMALETAQLILTALRSSAEGAAPKTETTPPTALSRRQLLRGVMDEPRVR